MDVTARQQAMVAQRPQRESNPKKKARRETVTTETTPEENAAVVTTPREESEAASQSPDAASVGQQRSSTRERRPPQRLKDNELGAVVFHVTSVRAQVGSGVLSLCIASLGDFAEFRAFWDQFDYRVHQRKDLSNAAKLTYLRGCLTGRVAEVISSLSSSNADYEVALKRLREVIRYQIKKLLQAPPKDVSLRTHYDFLRRTVDALTALGKDPRKGGLREGELSAAEITIAISRDCLPTPVRIKSMGISKGIAGIGWVTLPRLAGRHPGCATLTSLDSRQERRVKPWNQGRLRPWLTVPKRLLNCLFDTGAERSLLRQDIADEFNVEINSILTQLSQRRARRGKVRTGSNDSPDALRVSLADTSVTKGLASSSEPEPDEGSQRVDTSPRHHPIGQLFPLSWNADKKGCGGAIWTNLDVTSMMKQNDHIESCPVDEHLAYKMEKKAILKKRSAEETKRSHL
ncbi:hypothetical protein T01_8746 [Trichinella spiralis]|uniref:Peptidase A2 domain-containing protein n=1 Tax=Trichinella spiralis TaxID=6334 RepID=A0A0V1B5A5_TRISP|nr:hypothetical protein T01_8746 [Trichinella spiralis]